MARRGSIRLHLAFVTFALAWTVVAVWLGTNVHHVSVSAVADPSNEGKGEKVKIRAHATRSAAGAASPHTCGQVYFWAGGKSGSTTLYFTLARGPGGQNADPETMNTKGAAHKNITNPGPIKDLKYLGVGKEPCDGVEHQAWAEATTSENICTGLSPPGGMEQTHILNGCPSRTSAGQARTIMNLDANGRTTFLMPIRDPADRLISFLNDAMRRSHATYNLEEKAKRMAERTKLGKRGGLGERGGLWFQGAALRNLLSVVTDPLRVLIVPLESMTNDMQGVVDDIMDHIGAERWKVNATSNTRMNSGEGRKNFEYRKVTNATRDLLRDGFREDVLLLESLVGREFPWSSWARGDPPATSGEGAGRDWRTATPSPRIDAQRVKGL